MAKLSTEAARRQLSTFTAKSTFADVEAVLGPPTRTIERHDTVPTHVFVLPDGEVRVGSRDKVKLRFVRVFARPAGLPAAAVLDDHAAHYVIDNLRSPAGDRMTETYALDTGKLIDRTTYRNGCIYRLEETAPDGSIGDSLEPLLVAIHGKRKGEVKQRLATASPLVRDEHGATLLHHLAAHYRDPGFAKELIERGAEVDARDQDQRTPLYVAIQQRPRRSDFVDALVEAGADLDARCWPPFSNTVLHLACDSKSGAMTEEEEALAIWLIERGASFDLADSNGATARTIATVKGKPRILDAINRAPAAKQPAAKQPAAKKPASKQPAAKQPASKTKAKR